MIRVEVNAGDFVWEVLQDNLNVGNIYHSNSPVLSSVDSRTTLGNWNV